MEEEIIDLLRRIKPEDRELFLKVVRAIVDGYEN